MIIMMFFCESVLEAQLPGTRAAANKSKNKRPAFYARDMRRLMRGGGMEEEWGEGGVGLGWG